jgi:hypothetical protein
VVVYDVDSQIGDHTFEGGQTLRIDQNGALDFRVREVIWINEGKLGPV